MGMKLDRLEQLHNNMKSQGIQKVKFDFTFRTLSFSVIYIAESFPHELLFGCRGHNLFFVVDVPRDFTILTHLKDAFQPLCDALELKFDPKNPFSANVFFHAFKDVIPITASPSNVPTITDIASNRKDVEEAHKIHFCGWIHHDGISSNATPSNLAKTKRICGEATYNCCSDHNISSKWTDNKELAQKYHEPPV